MTHEEIEKKVITIVAKCLSEDDSSIDINANLRDEYGADSLDVVSIVMDVEKCFSISIDDRIAESIKTTKDVIDEVKRNVLD